MLAQLLILIASVNTLVASKSPQRPTISQTLRFDVDICGREKRSFNAGMFGSIVPRTVKNFVEICKGNRKLKGVRLSYENTVFHRIIPKFMIQGGDFTKGNGSGGMSIWGEKFNDENFRIGHSVGVLSMANSGPNSNGSQFFITTSRATHLNGKHTVFGIITSGMDVVYRIEAQGRSSGKPRCPVRIVKCTLLQ
jgi:peptidylprolyl isomerase